MDGIDSNFPFRNQGVCNDTYGYLLELPATIREVLRRLKLST